MKKLLISLSILLLLATNGFTQKPTDTTREAANLLNAGDINGAMSVLDAAILKDTDLLESYKMRAFLHQMKGDLSGSISDLSEAIKIDSSDASLYARRGDLKVFARDESALEDFDLAIANGHKTHKVYLSRAMFYRNEGNLDKAEADYRTAFGLKPESPQTVVGLASILHQRNQIDEAISILQDFTSAYESRKDGKLPKSDTRVIAESKEIKSEGGRKDGNQTIIGGVAVETRNGDADQTEFNLNLAVAYANLAQLLTVKDRLDQALVTINKGLAIDSTGAYAIGIRGKIYMEKRDFTNALNDFNKSIQAMPTLPNHYIDRGIIHLIKDDKTKAQADFDKFLSFNSTMQKVIDKRVAEAKEKYNF